MDIISFQEALEKAYALDKKPKLLLGNGFSISFDKETFSVNHYYDIAVRNNLFEGNQRIHTILESIDIDIFEDGMYDLQKFISLLSLYNSYGSILDKLTEEAIKDLRELKRIFITSVVLNHPPGSFAIERNQYDACVKFLKNFCFIYTLNYDLLLYWVIVKNTNVLKFQDGFSRLSGSSELIWYPESEASTTLYYLHGALHLIQDKQYIKKHSWKCSGIPLKDQIQSKLNQNKLPLFVSGGITSEKASLILKYPYLYSGFNSLSNCNDTLFVHGFGFNSNDLHIIDAIAESNIEKLFISIYKPNENFSDWLKINSAIERINFVRDFLTNKKINIDVFYYDAETANVWGNRVKADAKVPALEM